MGDRRDHFEAFTDLWVLLTTVVEERKKREIDPTLTMLRQSVLEADEDTETPADIKERISSMLSFIETLSTWHQQVQILPKSTLVKLMKLGARVAKFVGG